MKERMKYTLTLIVESDTHLYEKKYKIDEDMYNFIKTYLEV